ncbi:hypothetical protein O9929_15025 [Vibrio lentus]|nr:hypothetical protein [Vibrio lentus]
MVASIRQPPLYCRDGDAFEDTRIPEKQSLDVAKTVLQGESGSSEAFPHLDSKLLGGGLIRRKLL